jgi:hypothetical protein
VRLLVAAGIAALLVAGCSKGSAPTKAQYSGVANGVCTAAHDELAKLTAEHQKKNPDGGANQRFVRAKLIPRLKSMTGELRSIQPPETDGAYLHDVYADYDHALDLWYSDPLGDSKGPATKAVETRMARFGLKACSTAGHIDVAKNAAG